MRQTFKTVAIAVAALLALLVAAAAILLARFDPNDYKPQLVRLVQEKTQRTLTIPGDIRLRFFPKIGVEIGKAGISGRNSTAGFASLDSARVSLALMPLLSKQVVVDRIRIDGLRADIRRNPDGTTNFDDLLARDEPAGKAKPEAGGQPFRFDIDGIQLNQAHLLFDDRQQGRRLEIARLDLETGKIAPGAPGTLKLDAQIKGNRPDVDARVLLKTGFALDPERRHYLFKGIDVALQGALAGWPDLDLKVEGDADLLPPSRRFLLERIRLNAKGKRAGDTIEARFELPRLAVAEGKVGGGKLSGEASMQGQGRRVAAAIVVPAFEGTMQDFRLPELTIDAVLRADKLEAKAKLAGSAAMDVGKRTATATLKGSLDGSACEAKLGLADFAAPSYTFDLAIDRLDLDRYRSKPAPAPAGKAPAPEPPLTFSFLQALRATGSVRVGDLTLADIHAANVRLGLRAADGRLDVAPFSASLYGGSAVGALSVSAGHPARFHVRQTLTGIDIGALMKAATGKDALEGTGQGQIDLAFAGASVERMKKALNGSVRLALRDGAIRGVNIAQTLREAKARIGRIRGDEKPQGGTGSAAQKTDFSELTASFRIVEGVAHNEDLSLKSPLLRVGGAGDIFLAEDRLDYLARATIVSTLQGQGGPELQALKGWTVPVHLSGPFDAIGWRVDLAGMASELAKQKFDERKEELRAKAQKSLDEQKEKIRGRLQEQLKGLLGR